MGQTPVYRHISDLDNTGKHINLIEANLLMSVLGLDKEPEARYQDLIWVVSVLLVGEGGGWHMKPQESNICMSSQLYEF